MFVTRLTFCCIVFISACFVLVTRPFSNTPLDNGEPGKTQVILARKWDQNLDISGWWMSEKLDGVRGYWTGKELVSRSGNRFHAPQWFTQHLPSTPLDGELWIGRGKFSELVSVVRSNHAAERWKQVRYMVFDAPQVVGGFEDRLEFARRWLREHPVPHAEVLKQEVCKNQEQLEKKLSEIESAGGEGVMLRRPGSPYKIGRSSDLLKVKTFQDSEAIVIKHLPGSGRNLQRLGALLVQLPNGIQFAIGTGFSDHERENPPPIGSIITFKYYGLNKSGTPRFASFLRPKERF